VTGNVSNDPALVAKLVKVFSRTATSNLISNLDIKLQSYQCGDATLPLSISDPPNCYICSPSIAYLDYAIEETRHFLSNATLKTALTALIKACRPLMRATRLDRQVQPNNWLFSTNPVPAITAPMAQHLRDDLKSQFPDRAIVIRSLNTVADQASMAALKSAGFTLLPARQIYIFDATAQNSPSNDMKRDRKLLETTPYTLADAHTFSANDFTRAAELYHMLYVGKYTGLNPQYTPSYLAQAHQIGLLRMTGLRGPDDTLDGVVGLFENGQTLTVPIIGYDTSKPQKAGLYRMLNAIAQNHAITHNKFYNMSAGAAGFKSNRQAIPVIEYSAVYVGHLGLRARAATRIVKAVLDWIGIPLLKRFEL
jgi:hypothetical protein